jgi:predicted enzyme related to lactoylglutathione lyase
VSTAATSTAKALGQFVRHDLMSIDPAVSETFFTGLFGWRVEHRDMMGLTLRVIFAGDHQVGAIMPFDAMYGAPSHWVGYVADDAVEATAATIEALDGVVCLPPMDIPFLGRMLHLNDANGALFLSLKPGYDAQPCPDPVPGTVCWNELIANDPAKSIELYGALYGWTVDSTRDMGEQGTYTVMAKDGVQVAGIMQRQPEISPLAMWVFYFLVEDLEGSVARVGSLGGKATTAIMPVPGIGRFAVCQDPTGAGFALFSSR